MNEIILEISGFCITVFCIIVSLRSNRETYRQIPKGFLAKLKSRRLIFISILVVLCISAVFSVLGVVIHNYMNNPGVTLLRVVHGSYYFFHNFLPFMFTVYIMNIAGLTESKGWRFFGAFLLPCIAGEALVLINPVTNWIFYVDELTIYHRGEYLWILYAIAALYIIAAMVAFAYGMRKLPRSDRASFLLLCAIAIFGIVLQALFRVTMELFFEAIAFLGYMVLLEEDRQDRKKEKNKTFDYAVVIILSMTFLVVIAMNIFLVYTLTTSQTDEIGNIQIDSIKGDLQELISGAESDVLRFAMGVEQLNGKDASEAELEEYITAQKEAYEKNYGGSCINVYGASSEWTIIPDFDMPLDYHATERLWYIGAKDNRGQAYVTEPYIDAYTGALCFTVSTMLSDNDTVVAMDFDLSGIRDSIKRMTDNKDQTAIIVTGSGMIVGYSDMELAGKDISDALSEYSDIFRRVRSSNAHDSFRVVIQGKKRVVFSNETVNGWYLILCVDNNTLYKESYSQILLMAAIDFMMVAVIVVFYFISLRNKEKAEKALNYTENFLTGISGQLRDPLGRILRLSDKRLIDKHESRDDIIENIREESLRLSQMMENLFSFADILKQKPAEKSEGKKERTIKDSTFSVTARNLIVLVLVLTFAIGLAVCVSTTVKWGNDKLERELDQYQSQLSEWVLRQQTILDMFCDMISQEPEIVDDYESAVKWLDGMAKNYPDISVCYIANPYKDRVIIMNNGWQPEEGWVVEERPWYKETESSSEGYSISSPYLDDQTGLYCMTFSEIVYGENGEFLGVFGIDFYMDKLIEVLAKSYTENSYAFLADSDGVIINHPSEEYQMSPMSSTSIEDTAYADVFHQHDIEAFRDYDGRLVTCHAGADEQSGFTVMVVNNWLSIYGNVIIVGLIFLIILTGSVLVVTILVNRLIHWQERANERLKEAADAAVAAGEAKSHFLAQMSHEIRTPINAVLGMNEMILRESRDDNILEYSDNIKSAGRTLLSLINTILDFSKIEDGKMEILPVKYDTAQMIGSLITAVSERAREKGLKMETEINKSIPSYLFGDDMRISQVILNLLTNAVKYTETGTVTLCVDENRLSDDETQLLVSVRDTGIGIKEEDRERLFESFTRLDENRNRTIEGTGLGMSIVVNLLDMMDSKLEVESEYGIGSVFSFKLKQKIVNVSPMGDFEDRIKSRQDKDADDKCIYAPDARLLVVDDNKMNLKVVGNLLKRNGIVPDMVISGQEAIEAVRKNKYDLILLDHMMPKMDGIETLEYMKNEGLLGDNTPVIALTANAVTGAREMYLEKGFDDYLSKPIEVPALEEILSKYLPAKNAENEEKAVSDDDMILEFGPGQDTLDDPFDAKDKDDSKAGDNGGNAAENRSEEFINKLKAAGLSTEDGLRYCAGDTDFYSEMLSDFADSAKGRIKELETYAGQEDWKAYQISVHALKSVLRTIGAADLSQKAQQLEDAAGREEAEFIRSGQEDLLGSVEDISRKIYDIIGQRS